MSKLSLLDLGFFLTETEASPKHVGALMIFSKPSGASEDFTEALYHELTASSEVCAPFNQVVQFPRFGAPYWATDPDFDIRNHVFHRQLPAPGGDASLRELVSELHTPLMARDKPIWEFHIIDGLDDAHFALYMRIHHAYADGMSMSAWLLQSLNKSPRAKRAKFVWMQSEASAPEQGDTGFSLTTLAKSLTGSTYKQIKMLAGLSKLSTQLALEGFKLTKNAVAVPFKASHNTPLTGQVTAGRQVATAKVSMERVNRIRKLTRSTLNHVALTCIDGALHRYLDECGASLEEPITIQMPVNLRQKGDAARGNKIGIVLVDLARRTSDPYERLRDIGFTLRNVRYQIDGVPSSSVIAYTLALGTAAQLAELLNLSDVVPPLGNTLVSNVPGPRQPLYLKGAKLESMYPISALTPANHMNITLFSYDKHLHFGLVATRALPHLDKLSDYIVDAFVELETAIAPLN